MNHSVRPLVDGADLLELVAALVEPDAAGALPAMEPAGFPCPSCQARPAQWVLRSGGARLVDADTWACSLCGRAGTRWGAARRVLEDPAALRRFLSPLATAA